ncbi:MAG TPA: glycosyltransferase [Candidatus Angelobacter sp.]|jgi:glycosyltransferase involved in cell wall biosynthesis|nr:glycosyltransferase [Candidatus Angelobacter sp.]
MTAAMRLVLDLQACQDVRNGDRGIGRYVAGLAEALHRRGDAVAAMVLNPQLPFPGHLDGELLDSPLLSWNTAGAIASSASQGDVAYHLMSPFEMSTPGCVAVPYHALGESTPLVATLYDLIPLRDPSVLPDADAVRRYRQRLELVRTADLLLCISEHTRQDAIRRLGVDPSRSVNVGGGASPRFGPGVPALPPEVRRRIVLCVSGGVPRKNTERLISAYAQLPESLRAAHQLVVACDLHPDTRAAWSRHAQHEGLRDGEMVLTGFVSDDTLLSLYRSAALVVMPSLDEGFGLPVAEAIACDRPVITSNLSALPEILDMPESTFDPYDVADMSRVMQRALADEGFRDRLLDAGRRAQPHNTWDAVAERMVSSLQRLDVPRRGRRVAVSRRERRMRIALVGPMPPVKSGVADYNGRTVSALSRLADVDVLVPPEVAHPGHGGPLQTLRSPALGRTLDPAGYDALLYTFGNSEHHLTTYDLAHRYPGVLWLHDVRLSGFHANYAHERTNDPARWMRKLLRDTYGAQIPDLDNVEDLFERAWLHHNGVFLSRSLVRASRAVIVNSRFAEQLYRLDQGPDGVQRPLIRLPFAAPVPPAHIHALQRDTSPPLIVSAGSVDWIKGSDRLIEAFARIANRTPAQLVFVGVVVPPQYQAELQALADRLGVGDRVSFTGRSDEEDWWEYLRRATVAVQLRRLTNGETSGAVADAQAVGTPVITNLVNARIDYPEGALVALDSLAEGELEGALLRLVSDRAVWQRQSAAGLAHARSAPFDRLASLLLERLDALLSGRLESA